MKSVLLAIFLITQLNGFSQQTSFKTAVCQKCVTSSMPSKCSEQEIEKGIVALINDDLISDLPSQNKNNYFSLSVFFVVDGSGKLAPRETEVRTESEKLKSAVADYINNLTPFIPKAGNIRERNTVYVVNYTFIANEKTNNYYIADATDIKKKKIVTNYITYSSAALFKGCENKADFNEEMECSANSIIKYLKKNYKKPPSGVFDPVGVGMILIADSDGKLSVETFNHSAPDDYEKEAERIVNTMPNLKPARIKGIPSAIRFSISLVIR